MLIFFSPTLNFLLFGVLGIEPQGLLHSDSALYHGLHPSPSLLKLIKHVAVWLTEHWAEDKQVVVVTVAFEIGKVGSGTTKKFQSSVISSQNILIHNLSLKDTYKCWLALRTCWYIFQRPMQTETSVTCTAYPFLSFKFQMEERKQRCSMYCQVS